MNNMGYARVLRVVLFLCAMLDTVGGNQLMKLKKDVNILNDKFESLQDKIYNDGFDIQREIEALWRQLNGTSDIKSLDETGKDANRTSSDIPRGSEVDKMVKQMDKRNKVVLKVFSDEKRNLRDRMTKFENDIITFRNRHEHELTSLRNSLYNLALDINDTLNNRLDRIDHVLTQTAVNVQQKFDYDFDALNITILKDFDSLKDSIVDWKIACLTFLENRVIDMEVKQNNALELFMNKAKETLTRLKSTSDEGHKKATAAQEFAKTKATELEMMMQTLQKVSDECVKKSEYMNHLNSLLDWICYMHGGKGGKRVGHTCLKLSTNEAVTWTTAVEKCSQIGGYLVEVPNDEIKTELVKFGRYSIWIGGSDIKTEGRWVWKNSWVGIPDKHPYWNQGEPNGDTTENCIELFGGDSDERTGKWNDNDCNDKRPYVCAWNLL